MNPQRPRQPPNLEPTATTPRAPDLFTPQKERPPSASDSFFAPPPRRPAEPETPDKPPRKPRLLASILLWIVVGAIALVIVPVLLLRWVPVPTTAFMLQSPSKPVRYQWVSAEQIPASMRKAVVAAEDQKFFQHRGFDLEAIDKAREHNKAHKKKRGASTISQQTAKNLFLWSGGGYFRKGIEAGMTIVIETLWPKDRILEVYLNVAEFGPGVYGVEAAAQRYFGRSALYLSAEQCARLAAVLPSPRRWNVTNPGPYVAKRSAWILRQMGGGGHRAPIAGEGTPGAPGDTAPIDDLEPELPPELDPEADDVPDPAAVVDDPEPTEEASEIYSGKTIGQRVNTKGEAADVRTRALKSADEWSTAPIPIDEDTPLPGAVPAEATPAP
ncbi:MAG: monofunctional biosynthetic peptidoglycan transglycosylase [Pseudomonadota bacterium]|nr:monofunctional biosynthetic peptidoglycan transglycosylase [Pseudomonadota bacterium]